MSRDGILLALILVAAAAILGCQLFVPPIVGLADQGDFVRTIGRFGYGPQHHGSLEYVYVEPKYVPDPRYRSPYWEQANSEYLFVGVALLLNKIFSTDGTLDIRMAGLVHGLAFLAAFARLLFVTRRIRGHPLIWIGALAALTDVGYVVYLNSWYAEPASCIFLLLLLAEAVEIATSGRVDAASLTRWSAWSVLWVFAKPQNAPIGIILGLFTLRLTAWARTWSGRAVAVSGACGLFACTAYNIAAMPVYGRMANTYGMIFSGILADSKNPAGDLRALGLDPRLANLAGTGAWTPGTRFPEMAASGELRRVNTFTVLRFYLARPARALRRLHGLLPVISFLRRDWYGNFEPSAGRPPAAQSRAFALWSAFHERVLPRVNQWIVFALAAWLFGCIWKWVRARDSGERRQLEFLVLLPGCCLAALFGAVYGDAFDVIKHMYAFNLLLDACMIYVVLMLWRGMVASHVFDRVRTLA